MGRLHCLLVAANQQRCYVEQRL